MIYDFKLNIVRNNNTIGTLSARRCNIAFDSTKEVKRTCRVEIKPESDVISKGIVKVDSFMFDGLHFLMVTGHLLNQNMHMLILMALICLLIEYSQF